MATIQSDTFSTAELRQVILAVEVLREIRKDEASTLDFVGNNKQADYNEVDNQLGNIQKKLEAFLLDDEIEKLTNEVFGHERPQERAAAISSI